MHKNGSRKRGTFGKLLLWAEGKASISPTGVGRKERRYFFPLMELAGRSVMDGATLLSGYFYKLESSFLANGKGLQKVSKELNGSNLRTPLTLMEDL